MSGVFSRFHEPTGWDFVDTAVDIEIELYKFLRKEKNIPKRCWLSHGLPLYLIAKELNNKITDIKSAFPTSEKEVEDEKLDIQKAIKLNENIIKTLQMTVLELPNINVNDLDHLGELLKTESRLLRKLKPAVAVRTRSD